MSWRKENFAVDYRYARTLERTLADAIKAYADAPKSERMIYARYHSAERALGKTPKIFYDWQREKETV